VSRPINCIVFPRFFHHCSNILFIALRITFFALPLDHLYKTTARKPIPSLPHGHWFPDEWATLKAAEAPCLYHSPCSFPLHADAPMHLRCIHQCTSCTTSDQSIHSSHIPSNTLVHNQTLCFILLLLVQSVVVAYIVIVNNNFYSHCKHRLRLGITLITFGACAEPSQADASRVLRLS
jgi:hypothetical protein